ncbi:MAG: SPOR domain-containing protein [Ignavibacteriae bacterium]|nr:SPOR domain-containing protein [Ignavibacteriota bacterium]
MRSMILLPMVAAFLGVIGCGPSDETSRESPPDTTSQTRRTTFETSTDTVTAQGASAGSETTHAQDDGVVRFTVQIGSFRDAKNASLLQTSARQRLQLPVVNVYNAAGRLYQVRVGFFETEEQAIAFRGTLLQEYSHEYKDAWVVEINK